MFHKVEVILRLQLESSIKIVVRFFIWSDALIVSWSGWLVFLLVTSVSETCKSQPLFFIQGEERQKFHTYWMDIEYLSHRGKGAKRLKLLVLIVGSVWCFDAGGGLLSWGEVIGARISSYYNLNSFQINIDLKSVRLVWKLNLGRDSEASFGQYFEFFGYSRNADVWLRFWS